MVRKFYISSLIFAVAFSTYAFGQRNAGTPGYDTLGTFRKLCSQISDYKGNYTLAGVISIKNPTNPNLELKNEDFLFCKSGSQFYYQLGATQMLNESGVYLYIDHDRRNILLSPQKQVGYDQPPLSLPDVTAMLKSEHYRLVSSTTGNERTITLLNEHHISCKQYSLTFNKDNLKLKRLFMRLTDLRNPDDRSTEEVVDVRIVQWERTANLGKYLTKNKVIRTNGRAVSGTGNFRNYKVIKM